MSVETAWIYRSEHTVRNSSTVLSSLNLYPPTTCTLVLTTEGDIRMYSIHNFQPFCSCDGSVFSTQSMRHEFLDGCLFGSRIIHQSYQTRTDIADSRSSNDTTNLGRRPAVVTTIRLELPEAYLMGRTYVNEDDPASD